MLAVEKAAISSRITVTKGSIASKTKEIFAKTLLFLITARVRGGFSGGPIINSHGNAIGIISRQPVSDQGEDNDMWKKYDNLGYGVAIPSEEIIKFIEGCKNNDNSIMQHLNTEKINYTDFPE